MLVVNVCGYGDFYMKYVHSSWVSNDYTSLPSTIDRKLFAKDSEPNKLIKELKALGFKQLKTHDIYFGGDL